MAHREGAVFVHARGYEIVWGPLANITSAYINDIPGSGVKKDSLASLWLHRICKQVSRKQHVIPVPLWTMHNSMQQRLP